MVYGGGSGGWSFRSIIFSHILIRRYQQTIDIRMHRYKHDPVERICIICSYEAFRRVV
jgi:hypothetical protein